MKRHEAAKKRALHAALQKLTGATSSAEVGRDSDAGATPDDESCSESDSSDVETPSNAGDASAEADEMTAARGPDLRERDVGKVKAAVAAQGVLLQELLDAAEAKGADVGWAAYSAALVTVKRACVAVEGELARARWREECGAPTALITAKDAAAGFGVVRLVPAGEPGYRKQQKRLREAEERERREWGDEAEEAEAAAAAAAAANYVPAAPFFHAGTKQPKRAKPGARGGRAARDGGAH